VRTRGFSRVYPGSEVDDSFPLEQERSLGGVLLRLWEQQRPPSLIVHKRQLLSIGGDPVHGTDGDDFYFSSFHRVEEGLSVEVDVLVLLHLLIQLVHLLIAFLARERVGEGEVGNVGIVIVEQVGEAQNELVLGTHVVVHLGGNPPPLLQLRVPRNPKNGSKSLRVQLCLIIQISEGKGELIP